MIPRTPIEVICPGVTTYSDDLNMPETMQEVNPVKAIRTDMRSRLNNNHLVDYERLYEIYNFGPAGDVRPGWLLRDVEDDLLFVVHSVERSLTMRKRLLVGVRQQG